MCEVPAKIVAPHLFFLSHFLLKRCCPSFIIQSSDFSCCFSCRKKHKLREAQNLVFLSRIPQAKHPRLRPLHSTANGHSQCTISIIKHPRQQDDLNYHLWRQQSTRLPISRKVQELRSRYSFHNRLDLINHK